MEQYKLEMLPGTLTVYANAGCAVSIVGRDGLVATVLTGQGELVVKLEQHGADLWTHTFSYHTGGEGKPQEQHDGHNGHQEPTSLASLPSQPAVQRRRPGRPQGSTRVPKPGSVMNLDGELVSR